MKSQKFFAVLFFNALPVAFFSQCFTYTSAVSDITLQCSGGTANRSAVAFYPTKNVYYSVNHGSAANPIETFSVYGGAALASTPQGADFNGFWYNQTGKMEGNVAGTGTIVREVTDPITSFPIGISSATQSAGMPDPQSCGQLAANNTIILYYHAQALYKYSRITGALISTVAVTGLPATTLNGNSVIYTGVAGSEAGLYDYVNRCVYFVDYTSGVYVGTCLLPSTAPIPSLFGVGYAQNRLFLFDAANLRWQGYKLTTVPEVTFYGYNISCRNMALGVSVNTGANAVNTLTWSSNFASVNNHFLLIPQPTVSAVYSVTVADTLGCSTISSFVNTVYPSDSTVISVTGIDSVFCTPATQVTLSATGAVTYSWNTGPIGSTVQVTPTTTSVYWASGTNSLGCKGTGTFTVSVYGGPTVTAVSSATLICSPQTLTLNASGALTYTWSGEPAGSSMTVASPPTSAAYTVTGENAIGCKDVQIVGVVAGIHPTLNISGPAIICSGKSANLYVYGANSYTWSTNEFTDHIVVSPPTTTSYTVTGMSSHPDGCPATAVRTQSVVDCQGIDNNSLNGSNLSVYPNPTSGELKIKLSEISSALRLEIYDAVGMKVLERPITEPEVLVDLSDKPKGLYVVVVTGTARSRVCKKVVKQ